MFTKNKVNFIARKSKKTLLIDKLFKMYAHVNELIARYLASYS